jgi:hypothetical protein
MAQQPPSLTAPTGHYLLAFMYASPYSPQLQAIRVAHFERREARSMLPGRKY